VQRLAKTGILNERTVAAHCVHVTGKDIATLAERRVNVVHNPESNCNNAVGAARLHEMAAGGVRVGLGSDGYSPRMWDEFKTALHVQQPSARAAVYAAAFANNRDIVRDLWGMDVGRIAKGARADFILVDYFPPTPLTPENLSGHLLFGIANAPIHSLVVNGRQIVQNGHCVTVDERAIAEKASIQARSLWRRFENS
jgi:cytosine/adenosine deaminase-related metal-dependent hydrolase